MRIRGSRGGVWRDRCLTTLGVMPPLSGSGRNFLDVSRRVRLTLPARSRLLSFEPLWGRRISQTGTVAWHLLVRLHSAFRRPRTASPISSWQTSRVVERKIGKKRHLTAFCRMTNRFSDIRLRGICFEERQTVSEPAGGRVAWVRRTARRRGSGNRTRPHGAPQATRPVTTVLDWLERSLRLVSRGSRDSSAAFDDLH
jgi:hypothetical protein